MALDVKGAFRFPTRDADWVKKIAIGGVVSCIPIVFFAATGFIIQVMTATIEGDEDDRLPDWSDVVDHLAQGFIPFCIAGVYLLAGLIPMAIFWMSSFFVYGMKAGMDKGLFQGGTFGVITGLLAGLAGLAVFVAIYGLIPMALAYYAQTGDAAGAFRLPDIILRVRSAFGDWIKIVAVSSIPVLMWMGLNFVPFGIWKQVPAVIMGFYVWVVVARLVGELTRDRFALPDQVSARSQLDLTSPSRDEEVLTPGELTIDSGEVGNLNDLLGR